MKKGVKLPESRLPVNLILKLFQILFHIFMPPLSYPPAGLCLHLILQHEKFLVEVVDRVVLSTRLVHVMLVEEVE